MERCDFEKRERYLYEDAGIIEALTIFVYFFKMGKMAVYLKSDGNIDLNGKKKSQYYLVEREVLEDCL